MMKTKPEKIEEILKDMASSERHGFCLLIINDYYPVLFTITSVRC